MGSRWPEKDIEKVLSHHIKYDWVTIVGLSLNFMIGICKIYKTS